MSVATVRVGPVARPNGWRFRYFIDIAVSALTVVHQVE